MMLKDNIPFVVSYFFMVIF